MSQFDSGNLETAGYFLPEDSQRRLKKLREYVEFLANLARPRMADERQESSTEMRVGDVGICLELLEEQIGLVLGELSWPAVRGERAMAPRADAETETDEEALVREATEADVAGPVTGDAGERHPFGVSLRQIDEINLLLESLRAHGSVVTCSDHAELSDVTLSIMGDAIVRDTQTLRDIIDGIYDEQRQESPHGTKPGVSEEGASYLALPARLHAGGPSHVVRQHRTYQ